jgi:xylan 1,4-beta-xylosidase
MKMLERARQVTTLQGARRFGIAFCGLLALAVHGQEPAPVREVITVRADAPSQAFPHVWEQMFGSGRAILSLRESYRQDLRTLESATSVRYVRFHAILDDEVGVYDASLDGRPIYNWSYVDQVYDGLLANGVRPFVEMSFMPAKLAASLTPHAFWYKPLPSPPKNYEQWGQLVQSFAQHLVDRYGIGEVSQWYFEVWNEPNIDFWTGQPKQSTYFELYDHAARAIKQVNSNLRVGGPATAQAAWIPAMIQHAVQNRIPLDFVSTHVYGNDTSEDVFGTHENIPRSDMVARSVKKVSVEVKTSPRPDLPIIWSEYNASYKNEIEVTDSPFMGPWLANNIRLCDGLTAMMSYWTFSDVFEEQGVVKTPFYGGYGLIAAGGIPKAAFNAFAMLHRLGEQRMQPDFTHAIVTKRANGDLAIAVWNYAAPGESAPAKQIQIHLEGWNGTARYHVEVLDSNHGSALTAWRAMGQPAFPTQQQDEQLRKAAAATEKLESPSFLLPAHGLALVEVER